MKTAVYFLHRWGGVSVPKCVELTLEGDPPTHRCNFEEGFYMDPAVVEIRKKLTKDLGGEIIVQSVVPLK